MKAVDQKTIQKYADPRSWSFLANFYDGKFDGVIHEIEAQEMKNMSGQTIFEYPKLGMHDFPSMVATAGYFDPPASRQTIKQQLAMW